jgi:translocation and assembly module TamB
MARRRRIAEEFDDDDLDDLHDDLDPEVEPPRSRRRRRRPRRWRRFLLVVVLLLGAITWFLPQVAVRTPLRDLPLERIFTGIDGTIESGAAEWPWWGAIEYRDVVLRDRDGRAVVLVPRVTIDRGLLTLTTQRGDLGTLRLAAPRVLLEVRHGGSGLEAILAPWLAALKTTATAGGALPLDLVVEHGRVTIIDTDHGDGWLVDDIIAAATLEADATPAGWTVAGQLRHTGLAVVDDPVVAVPGPRLDHAAIAANATAVLTRDGGFSLSSPSGLPGPRRITANAHRLPLGVSAALASRFAAEEYLDGLADLRLELVLADAAPRASGDVALTAAAVRRTTAATVLADVGDCVVPFDLELGDGRVLVRRLAAVSPLVRAEASGIISLPEADAWQWAGAVIEEDFSATAQVDLAALARSLPGGLRVRPDVRLTKGRLELAATAHADGADRVLELRAAASEVAGVRSSIVSSPQAADPQPPVAPVAEEPFEWAAPLSAWLRGRLPPGRRGTFRIDEARLAGVGIEASASGTAEDATLRWTADLGTLFTGVAALFDMGDTRLAGTCRGTVDLTSALRGETGVVRAGISLSDFALLGGSRPPWRDAEMRLEAEATGRLSGSVALVERAGLTLVAAGDRLEAALVGGVIADLAGLVGAAADGAWLRPGPTARAIAAEGSLRGDLARWHARVAPFLPSAAAVPILGGSVDASATVAAQGTAWQITKAGGEVERFSIALGGRSISEPRIIATAAGFVDPGRGRYELSSGEVLSPTMSLRSGGVVWTPHDTGGLLDTLRGRLQWQADIGRMAGWFTAGQKPAWSPRGRTWGTVEVADGSEGSIARVEATGSQLELVAGDDPSPSSAGARVAPVDPPAPLWVEPQASLALEVAVPRGVDLDALRIERFELRSSTMALAAVGTIGSVEARRPLDLGGTVAWDWEQVSRLATPWTGGAVRLVGGGDRPFTLRGPLLASVQPVPDGPARPGDTATLLLPDSWLAATRGTGAEAPRAARITRPVAAAAARPATLADRLREIALDTSVSWQGAQVGGFPLAAGEMPLRLVEGQIAFGPFDIAASGGRLRGAPWISLLTTPRELVVPPGRIVERVAVADTFTHRGLGLLSPLLAGTLRAEGWMTVDSAGARLPLAAPLTGEAAGQIIFENLEVLPTPALQPLVNLLVKLQSVIDPRFAFGDKAVLLRVRPDPVQVRVAGGRVQHEGLVIDSGPLVIRSGGTVGADGSLAMLVEVALRAEFAGNAPVIARLLRTPLAIPLKGTVDRPQFDAGAIDTVLAKIVDNTAEAVLRDGLGRGLEGLETLFGNPPPPEAPLTLPPQR